MKKHFGEAMSKLLLLQVYIKQFILFKQYTCVNFGSQRADCSIFNPLSTCLPDDNISFMTGKGGKFSGGFDISSFGGLQGGQSMLYFTVFHFSLHYLIL